MEMVWTNLNMWTLFWKRFQIQNYWKYTQHSLLCFPSFNEIWTLLIIIDIPSTSRCGKDHSADKLTISKSHSNRTKAKIFWNVRRFFFDFFRFLFVWIDLYTLGCNSYICLFIQEWTNTLIRKHAPCTKEDLVHESFIIHKLFKLH